jgi:predicted ATPase
MRIKYEIPSNEEIDKYPLNIPFLDKKPFDLEINKKVLIVVGDNGSGKSTLLEAIAANCGFSLVGGNRNHTVFDTEIAPLSRYLRFSWKPRVSKGFFLRAETMFAFIRAIDEIAGETGRDIYEGYGGRSLSQRSHGEAFLSVFENRFGRQGLYIIDEPEAALSPERQIEFLRLMKKLDDSDKCQLIIATHSVLLMAYPNAQLLRVTEHGLKRVEFHDMPHFKIMRNFCMSPDAFIEGALMEDG